MTCSQDKQKCEGVQWTGSTDSGVKELAADLAGIRADLGDYSAALQENMKAMIKVLREISMSQQVLVSQCFEYARSMEGTLSTECSTVGDNPLWWEFWEWRKATYGAEDWHAEAAGTDGQDEKDEEGEDDEGKEDEDGEGKEDEEKGDVEEKEDGEVEVVG
jgi:hypothetical protein